MPKIANSIDPKVAEKMRAIAHIDTDAPAKPVTRIIKASTEPNPPRRLTIDDAVVIPKGMTTRFEARCVDCGTTVWLSPELPDGTDPSIPRVPICAKDAEIRCTYAALVEQRSIEIVRRNQQADEAARKKEQPMIDLNNMSDAAVGADVKKAVKATKARKVKKDRPKAVAAKKATEEVAKQRLRDEQASRKNLVFPAFKIDSVAVCPALDLTDKTLDEVVHAADRTHYNRARFRVLGEASLDPETTTWRVLAEEHVRLAKAAKAKRKERKAAKAAKAAAKPVKASKPAKKATKKVVAQIDVTEQAKRLAAFTGVSVERATELLSRT